MDGNLRLAPQIIKWNFKPGLDSQKRRKWTHECPLMFCVISVSRNNWEVLFCPNDPQYRAGGKHFRKADRYHRPFGKEQVEAYRDIDEALRLVKRYRTRREVYDHSKAGKFNLDDQPWEWRDEEELMEEALVRERVPKTPRKKRVLVEEPESSNASEPKPKKESLLTKYRPREFKEVLGQDDAIAATRATLDAGVRVIVFHGPSGVGKTTMALLAATEYLGVPVDNIVRIDGARYNTVEDINKELIPLFQHPPLVGDIRVIIPDECQRFSGPGWTVLLDALENVPPWLYVFFCTTEIDKVPTNIREQRATPIALQLVGTNDIFGYIDIIVEYERWKTPEEVIALCAQQALGSPRRGLSHLSKCHRCQTRDEALRILNLPIPAKELSPDDLGYRLAQALVTPRWRDVRALLRRIRETKENVEGVRLVVRAYFSTVIDNDDDEGVVCYALRILDHFSDPLPDYSYLQQAVGGVVFGGRTDGE